MNWLEIKKSHYHKEPVEHILTDAIFNLKEYDRPYNQNFNHPEITRVNNWKDIHQILSGRK
jgi:uncharacterized HAD superfamily protein